jgi:hypothetical protein
MPFGCSVQFLPSLFPSSRNQKQQPTYILTSKNYAPNAIMVIYTCSFIFSFFFCHCCFYLSPSDLHQKLSFLLVDAFFFLLLFLCLSVHSFYIFFSHKNNQLYKSVPSFFFKKNQHSLWLQDHPKKNFCLSFVYALFFPFFFSYAVFLIIQEHHYWSFLLYLSIYLCLSSMIHLFFTLSLVHR